MGVIDKVGKAVMIKAVCAVTTDRTTLDIAKWWEMNPGGRAAAHLDHYLQGSGAVLPVDLAKVFQDDKGVRFKVIPEIIIAIKSGKLKGTVAIPQSVYTNKEWQFALGSININWTFPSPQGADKAHIGFRNQYRWHPTEGRITQCIHEAAVRLQTSGAKDYWMEGQAEITLALAEWGQKNPRFHIVKSGESLSQLSQKYYGRADRWQDIHAANKPRIPDPNRVQAGIVLEIP